MMKEKQCIKCLEVKELYLFPKVNKNNKEYSTNECKECRRIRTILRDSKEIKKCLTCNRIMSNGTKENPNPKEYCSKECKDNCVPYEWNVRNALLLGWMTSDGCLHDKPGMLSFTNIDNNLIKNMIELAEIKNKIYVNNLNDKPAYQLRFTNYPLKKFLTQAGLTPRKSLTIEKINFPNKMHDDLFWAFLRGMIDGDGHVHKGGIVLFSGSGQFMMFIKKELLNRNISSAIIKKDNIFQLKINRINSIEIYKLIYINLNNKYELSKFGIHSKQETMKQIDVKRCIHCKKEIKEESLKRACNTCVKNNTKSRQKRKLKEVNLMPCKTCGKEKSRTAVYCLECFNNNRKTAIEWPEIGILIRMVKDTNYKQLSEKLGVSDNAIRKHLTRNNINYKTLEKI